MRGVAPAAVWPAPPGPAAPTVTRAQLRHHTGRARRRPGLLAVFGIVVACCILASLGWKLAGGSIYEIPTASMCPDLCVGTLVVDSPVTGPVHRGEVVTFRAPGTETLYTHRVVEVLSDGSFKTAGDARGTVDPWTVPPGNVVGHVVLSVRGLGWVWPVLPWLAAGLALVLVVRMGMSEATRRDWDRLFLTALLIVPILVLHPLVRDELVSLQANKDGHVHVVIANTGLLPTKFSAGQDPPVVIPPSHLVQVRSPASPRAPLIVHQSVALSWWEWAILVLVVLSPMIGYLGRVRWRRRLAPGFGRGAMAAAGALR